MKAGFTLIELILAFMFSTIILTVLFSSFFQINRSSILAEDLIDMDSRLYSIQNQLERDLSGAFVPVQGIVIEEKKKDEKEPKQEAEKKEKADSAAKQEKAAPEKPKEKKEKPKPIQDVFLSTNKGELLSELTFITNNPMQVYEYAKNAQVKPRMVRVMYRLVPDPKEKRSLTLTRQEGTEFSIENYKKNASKPVKAFELAEGIKNITVEFTAPVPKKEETKAEKAPEKEKKEQAQTPKKEKKKEEPIIFETKKEWHSDEIRKNTPKTSQLPQFVKITVTLWDNQFDRERTFTFNYRIVAFGQDVVKPEEPKKPKIDLDKEKKEESDKKAQEAKKAAAIPQRRYPSVAEMKQSIKEFVTTMNGKKA